MKFNNLGAALFIGPFFALSFSSCGGGSSSNNTTTGCANATQNASPTLQTTSSTNTLPLYVADPATTGNIGYQDEPLVSVTICSPGHTSASQCETISNILLDTGSYGLRVFSSVINSNVSLNQEMVTVKTGPGTTEQALLGECQIFGSGADWGSVETGDVVLGNQTATNIPIQVIDIHFASIPSGCAALSPDTSPCDSTSNFNGILGVGIFGEDCGTLCDSADSSGDASSNPGIYFGCDSTGCYNGNYDGSAVQVAGSLQVLNPVSALGSGFNNGVSLTLPAISYGGASAVEGSFSIGIGTTANNVPGSSVTVFGADGSGETDLMGADFVTTFNGVTYGTSGGTTQSFLDSGSNSYYFPAAYAPAGLTTCPDGSGFFCPASNTAYSATVKGFSGTPSSSEGFYIGNADDLFNNTSFSAFNNVGADSGTDPAIFDWGLPFFFGRTVYVGLSGQTAVFNGSTKTGPYWAF